MKFLISDVIIFGRHSREGGNPIFSSDLDPRVKPEDDNIFALLTDTK